MMNSPMSRPSILERHIDDILVRRFHDDRAFATAFAVEALRRSGNASVAFDNVLVARQVRHAGASGTIDILVDLLASGGETIRLLIENKIDSGFTPDQPERYAASAAAMSTGTRRALASVQNHGSDSLPRPIRMHKEGTYLRRVTRRIEQRILAPGKLIAAV